MEKTTAVSSAVETDEPWDYSFCAAFDITPLDTPTKDSSHTLTAMAVKVSSANQPYINKLFRMKPSDYSNDVVFTSDGKQNNPVRELVRTIGTSTDAPTRRDAAGKLAHMLAACTPAHVPKALLVVLSAKHGNRERVAIWRFPNEDTMSMVREGAEFVFSVTKTFVGKETREFKAASFEGVASKASMWNGRVKDFQTANRNIDVAQYWMKFLQCELQLRPDYATSLACRAIQKIADKAASDEEREQVEAAVVVLRAQDGKMKSMNEIMDTLPEPRRDDFVKALKLPEDQRERAFKISAAQVETAYKYRVISFENGIRLKAKSEAYEDHRINVERDVPGGGDRVTIRSRIVRDRPQAK